MRRCMCIYNNQSDKKYGTDGDEEVAIKEWIFDVMMNPILIIEEIICGSPWNDRV